MNKQLEEIIEAIKVLEDKELFWNNPELKVLEAIKVVLKELKRLQQENKDLKQANTEKTNKLIEIIDLYMKSVPKDKIREKIEKYKEIADEDNRDYFIKIEELKELLEGK